MSKKEEKELEKVEEKKLRLSGDGAGIGKQPAGFDEVDKEDLKMPRLAILQGLSKLCTEGKGKMGEIANSITREIYGESVEFIPLFMFKTRAQFKVGKGLVMMSRDNITVTMGLDEYEQYVGMPVEEVPGSAWTGKLPPTFNLVYNVPSLIVGRLSEFPTALAMMKTAAKPAKEFISAARYSGEDMFARVYKLSARVETGDKGTYAVPVIEFIRRATDEEYASAKKIFDQWYRRKKDIAVDLEEETGAGNDTVTGVENGEATE